MRLPRADLPLRAAILLYQAVALALAQIWANKVRALLTMLGIIIGVASVTAVVAAMTGLKQKVLDDFQTIGTNKIFIFMERPASGPMRDASGLALRFSPDQFDGLLEACPSVRTFSRTAWRTLKVRHADRVVDGAIQGIEPGWHLIENRSVTHGRPFSHIDNEQGRPVALVNPVAAQKLRLPRDPTGTDLLIGDRRFTVVGVVEPRTALGLFGDSSQAVEVFIPFSTAWRMSQGGMSAVAMARAPEQAEEARAELTWFLRGKRGVKPGEPNTFRIELVQQFIDKFQSIAVTMTLVAAGVVGISLLVGGVGIMNIMLVSVSERTREIGLRKAVGARPGAILLQFLVEAVTLCFVGGLIGVGLGELLARLLSGIPGAQLEKANVPAWAIAVSFGFSAVVGLVFGMFPAIKASRLDPIEALRHE